MSDQEQTIEAEQLPAELIHLNPQPIGNPVMRQINPDELKQRYSFRWCRSVSYFAIGFAAFRAIGFVWFTPLKPLLWVLFWVSGVLILLVSAKVAYNYQKDLDWFDGIEIHHLLIVAAGLGLAIASISIAAWQIGA